LRNCGLREAASQESRWSGQTSALRWTDLLCQARTRFPKRISCCISLRGPAESSYPSQGFALTGRPCIQKRTPLGRRKLAVQQPSQRQSIREAVHIQPILGPGRLVAIGTDTSSARLAIARALCGSFQSSAAERSHSFGVQPKPSSVKKQVKFTVLPHIDPNRFYGRDLLTYAISPN
jgi:hypothetical protein